MRVFTFYSETSLFLIVSIGCEPILKNSVMQGWEKCVHVRGKYVQKTAWYETGKIYWHDMNRIPHEIWTANI